MNERMRFRRGFSLLEIIVAAVLLALIMGGLANVFFAAKRWLAHSRFSMTSAELGKFYLDPLSMDVDQRAWNPAIMPSGDYVASDLTLGTRAGIGNFISGKTYTSVYNVTTVPSPGGGIIPAQMRKVRVDITWPEDD